MWFFLNTFSATDVPKYVVIQARDMLTRPMCIASSVYNITVGQSSLISLSLSLLQLTSGKPLWLYLQPVDTKSRWRHNWKSAQVVNSHLMCDSTIRQPGFELPRQQWSLLNHFSTEQGHCDACRRKWQLTDRHWSVSLWRDPDDVPHCWILSFDKTEWRLISATLCRWRRCFVADQLWFMTRIREEEEEECTAGPAGTLLLVYSLYPCFVLSPLHNFIPGTECVKIRVWCFIVRCRSVNLHTETSVLCLCMLCSALHNL